MGHCISRETAADCMGASAGFSRSSAAWLPGQPPRFSGALPEQPLRVTGALPMRASAFLASWAAATAFSSKTAASRSTKVMALVGQWGRQLPRPSQ